MGKVRKKFVVYTALFGDYDELNDPLEQPYDCDFICFTDQKRIKTKVWRIVYISKIDMPPKMMNRKFKMLPHLFLSNYWESLYIDSNILIKKNPLEFKNKYIGICDMAIPIHFRRKCIYLEAEKILKYNLADKNLILSQIKKYKLEGYPEGYGLTENNLIYRKHNNPYVIKIMNEWWEEYKKFPTRDQLSLMYVLWKNKEIENKLNIKFIDNIRGNKFFYLKKHKHSIQDGILGKVKNFKSEYIMNNPNSLFSHIYSIIEKIRGI